MNFCSEALKEADIGIIEYLEQDWQFAFCIDLNTPAGLSNPNGRSDESRLVYCNKTLRQQEELHQEILQNFDESISSALNYNNFSGFKRWTLDKVCDSSLPYSGIIWKASILRNRWKIVSGQNFSTYEKDSRVLQHQAYHECDITFTPQVLSSSSNHGRESPTGRALTSNVGPMSSSRTEDKNAESRSSIPTRVFDQANEDWIKEHVLGHLSPYVRSLYNFDWASTPLGPMSTWDSQLCNLFSVIMASPVACQLYWGDQLYSLYNEATIPLIGQHHPHALGMCMSEAFPEAWPGLKLCFDKCIADRITTSFDDMLLLNRTGKDEETYFSLSITPLFDRAGMPAGIYVSAIENTSVVMSRRRIESQLALSKSITLTTGSDTIWSTVLDGISGNDRDLPIAMLYSFSTEEGARITNSDTKLPKVCHLEGSLGITDSLKQKYGILNMDAHDKSLASAIDRALESQSSVLLNRKTDSFPVDLFDSPQNRGAAQPCDQVLIHPIRPTIGRDINGLLVIGLNPYIAYENNYRHYVEQLCQQFDTSFAVAILHGESMQRGRSAAERARLDQQELTRELQARVSELYMSEQRFKQFAEKAPIGIVILDIAGSVVYHNKHWSEIHGLSKEDKDISMADWQHTINPEDYLKVEEAFKASVQDKAVSILSFGLKRFWSPPSGDFSIPFTLSAVCYPELNGDGSIKHIVGIIQNISEQKWTEYLQAKEIEEGIKIQQQQNNFIDITSHEIRNPLNAILQSADDILQVVPSFLLEANFSPKQIEDVESIKDAAQTILYCAEHQKTIVDDILTLSKLEANLLFITPINVQPISVVQEALKMFKGELMINDIGLTFKVEKMYRAMGIDWVLLDPKRFLQLIINLLTNAIKFTKTAKKRMLTVSIDAASVVPFGDKRSSKIRYTTHDSILDSPEDAARDGRRDPLVNGTESKNNVVVIEDKTTFYLQFVVEDTGCGMTEEEMQLLFLRFSQASPKTHINYGGSGLGLYISRQLVQLQGGEIGVSSDAGVGSTFSFYIKVQKSQPEESSRDPRHKSTAVNDSPMHITTEMPKTTSRMSSSTSKTTSSKQDDESLAGISILLVEDNLINQKVLAKQLKRVGAKVSIANHGVEALSIINKSNLWVDAPSHEQIHKISIILMDVEMPIMGGLECTQAIRDLQSKGQIAKHVPIIAVTANIRDTQVKEMTRAGMAMPDDKLTQTHYRMHLYQNLFEL